MKYLKAMVIVVGVYFLVRWIHESPVQAGQTTNEAVDRAMSTLADIADRTVTFIQALGGSVILLIIAVTIIYLLGKAMK